MLPRHAIPDADWDRVKDLLPGRPGQHGGVARDNRLFLDAVLWVARTGAAWADLPARFGNPSTAWRRLDRWAARGRWDPVLAALRDDGLAVLVLDPTVVRAHPCAAGAKRSGTGPGARASRRWAAAAGGSGPRSTGASAGADTRSS